MANIEIGGRLHSTATGNVVTGANEVLDDTKNKKQSVINAEVDETIGDDNTAGTIKGRIKTAEGKLDTLNGDSSTSGSVAKAVADAKTELIGGATSNGNTLKKVEDRTATLETAVGSNGSVDQRIAAAKSEVIGDAASDYNTLGKLEDKIQAEASARQDALTAETNRATTRENQIYDLVHTPEQHYVTVATYADLANISSPSDDTIYRVSSYNGKTSQVDNTVYSEYGYDGTNFVFLCVKSQIDEVYDISAHHSNNTYVDLAAALDGGNNIPQELRRGGMSVKFVQSSDNKYVQYFLTKDEWSVSEADWEKMNLEEEISQLGKQDENIKKNLAYYRCESQASDSVKSITVANVVSLVAGSRFLVRFANVNTASDVTLRFGSEDFEYPLYYNGAAVSSENSWRTLEYVEIYYDAYEQIFVGKNYNNGVFKSGQNVSKVSIRAEIEQDSNDLFTSGAAYNLYKRTNSVMNISKEYPTGGTDGTDIYTPANARNKVPNTFRGVGQIIIYKTSESNIVIDFFTKANYNTDRSGWTNDVNWSSIVLNKDLDDINSSIDKIKVILNSNLQDITPTINWTSGYYIKTDGTVVASGGFYYSAPFDVNAFDVIKVDTATMSSSRAAISKVSGTGTEQDPYVYTPILTFNSDYTGYRYVFKETMRVALDARGSTKDVQLLHGGIYDDVYQMIYIELVDIFNGKIANIANFVGSDLIEKSSTIPWTSGIINKTEKKIVPSSSSYYAIITCQKGDCIRYSKGTLGAGAAAVSLVKSGTGTEQEPYVFEVLLVFDVDYNNYDYIIPSDGTYAICSRPVNNDYGVIWYSGYIYWKIVENTLAINTNRKSIEENTDYITSLQEGVLNSFPKAEVLPKLQNLIKVPKNGSTAYQRPIMLLHFSDIHNDIERLVRIKGFAAKFATYRNPTNPGVDINVFDNVICTGDMCGSRFAVPSGTTPDYPEDVWNAEGYRNIIQVIGNHDVYDGQGLAVEHNGSLQINYPEGSDTWINYSNSRFVATNQQKYERYLHNISYWGSIVQPTGAGENGYYPCYFYKDYNFDSPNKSINGLRLIAIDSMIMESTDQYTYDNGVQLAWITDVLADAKANHKAVVIASHFVPATGISDYDGFDSSFNCLTNYMGNPNYSDMVSGLTAAVDNFMNDNNDSLGKGEFVCYLCGHTHYDLVGTLKHTTNKQVYVVIGSAVGRNERYQDSSRVIGQITEDLFNAISFDTYNKLIRVARFGACYDQNLRHRGAVVIDYSDGSLVSSW